MDVEEVLEKAVKTAIKLEALPLWLVWRCLHGKEKEKE
jgi:hypothetical protein